MSTTDETFRALADELADVRKAHRAFRLSLLNALGVTEPWAITTWSQVDYVEAIERLRRPTAVPTHRAGHE